MTHVTVFRDFREDHRTSMEIYADNLIAALNNLDQTDFSFKIYRPHLGGILEHLPEKINLKMRAARYISYPNQAKYNQGDINHIMDHGYAHLMAKLDPSRTVITVHDIIPILSGRGLINGVTDQRRAYLAEYTSRFYKKAGRIISISKSTKRDLINHCGCDESRINVIYGGISSLYKSYSREKKEEFRKKLGLPRNVHLILVTGEVYYKNLLTSLGVMERLQKRYGNNIYLVMVGKDSDELRRTLSNGAFKRNIINIGYFETEQMVQLYNAVDCLLFPSWYEGFGWPPVEAMACGTPAVTSNVASLPEASGSAGVMKAPDDTGGLADCIIRVFEDMDFREDVIAKGIDHAKQFSWKESATKVANVYSQLIQV